MKRFVFKEARLLALRKQELTLAELQVARASQEVRAASATVQANLETLDELGDHVIGGRTEGFVVMGQIALGMRSRLEHSRQELAKREANLADAMSLLKDARVAMESLDTLKRLRQDQHREAMKRRTQQELDDVGIRKWLTEAQRD